MQESWAYPALYQEHGNRATDDLSILILQGRSVGGGTTVNWTSSFRTPERTLALWAARHGVRDLDAATLAPHFAEVERRLNVGPGNPNDVNGNNRKLQRRRRQAGLAAGADPPQRQRVRAARLLRHWAARSTPSSRRARPTWPTPLPPAPTSTPTAAPSWSRPTGAARAPSSPTCSIAPPTARARAWSPTPAAASCWPAAPSTRRRCCCARRPAPTAGRSGAAPSCTRRCRSIAFYDQPIEALLRSAAVGLGPPLRRSRRRASATSSRPRPSTRCWPRWPSRASGTRTARSSSGSPTRRRRSRSSIDGHHDDDGGTVDVNGDGRVKLRYPLHASLREAAVSAIADMARLQLAAGAREVMTLARDAAGDPAGVRPGRDRRGALRPQPSHDVLGAPDGRRGDGRGPRPAPSSTRAAATTSSRTSGSPTAPSSRPASASTRRSPSMPTRASSRPSSRRPGAESGSRPLQTRFMSPRKSAEGLEFTLIRLFRRLSRRSCAASIFRHC